MSAFQLSETAQISFVSTGDKFATFGDVDTTVGTAVQGGVQQLIITTTVDCYIDFDQPAVSSRSFFMPAAFTSPLVIDFHGGSVKTIHCIGKTGAGTLYIIAIRN